jgi:hypothetical protein
VPINNFEFKVFGSKMNAMLVTLRPAYLAVGMYEMAPDLGTG